MKSVKPRLIPAHVSRVAWEVPDAWLDLERGSVDERRSLTNQETQDRVLRSTL